MDEHGANMGKLYLSVYINMVWISRHVDVDVARKLDMDDTAPERTTYGFKWDEKIDHSSCVG